MKQQFPRPIRRRRGVASKGMNILETRYSEFLDSCKQTGSVIGWYYESVKFTTGKRCWYTPDFVVVTPDRVEIHEIKGYWEDDARVKWKANADKYPFFVWVAVKAKAKKLGGGWEYEYYYKEDEK